MLCLFDMNETKFARSFDSFREVSPEIIIEYDASLTGLELVSGDFLWIIVGNEQQS